ncbi:MAG: OmpA family protein, partial [Aquabacterium sp.]
LVWTAAPARADGAGGGNATAPGGSQPAAAMPPTAPATSATTPVAPAMPDTAGAAVALPITFESGSSRLTREAQAYIEPIALLLKADPDLRMRVEGHTDAIGQPRANLMLSWERAMSVMRVLVERHGIEPGRLQPLGKGATEPLDGTTPEAAANRRVQLRPLG